MNTTIAQHLATMIDIYDPADEAWPTGTSSVQDILEANEYDADVALGLAKTIEDGSATLDFGAGGTVRLVKAA